MSDKWMTCSACRTDIRFGARHYVCSVSTCNRNRTRLVFCSVGCWDSHLSVLRHRDAWAVEATAPSQAACAAERAAEAAEAAPPGVAPTTAKAGVPPTSTPPTTTPLTRAPDPTPPVRSAPPVLAAQRPSPQASAPPLAAASDDDVLIVVSKMKKYIRERSGMNTSDAVAEALSHHVRAICDQAIRTAGQDGRKTVLDRDVPPLRR